MTYECPYCEEEVGAIPGGVDDYYVPQPRLYKCLDCDLEICESCRKPAPDMIEGRVRYSQYRCAACSSKYCDECGELKPCLCANVEAA